MLKMILVGRTVSVNELREVNVNKEGKEPSYAINFRVASDREFGRMVTQADGTTRRETVSDFLNCVAYGNLAKTVDQFLNLKKEDGKILSRRIYLEGSLESYNIERTIEQIIEVEINGKMETVKVPMPVSYTGYSLRVDKIQFLDANPENQAKRNGTGVVRATVATDKEKKIKELETKIEQAIDENRMEDAQKLSDELEALQAVEEQQGENQE